MLNLGLFCNYVLNIGLFKYVSIMEGSLIILLIISLYEGSLNKSFINSGLTPIISENFPIPKDSYKLSIRLKSKLQYIDKNSGFV